MYNSSPMADSFTLTVPADAQYRTLGPDVAAKYAEVAGGTAAEGHALSTAVDAAIQKLVHGAHHTAAVDLAFRVAAGSVEVQLRCEGRSSSVKHVIHGHTH